MDYFSMGTVERVVECRSLAGQLAARPSRSHPSYNSPCERKGGW